MIAGRNSEDYYPLTWVGRYPVYLTTVLVAVHVVAMAAVAICFSVTGNSDVFTNPVLAPLTFSSQRILEHFSVWEFLTYAFVNVPSLWFAVEMYLLLVFGREVEKFLGRRAFGWLYLALVLAPPTVLTGLEMLGIPAVYAGSGAVHFAIFIAFVVIYPSAEILFGIQAKWIALILVAINSLQCIAFRAWIPLGILWLECLCAFTMLRIGGIGGFGNPFEVLKPKIRPSRAQRKLKVLDREEEDPFESIDPLLEKISKHGIASLNKRERDRLEKAREELIEREKGH